MSGVARVEAEQRLAAARGNEPYRKLYGIQGAERIALIKAGVLAAEAKRWLDMPTIGALAMLKALDLSAATFNRKVKSGAKLSKADSERVVGFARLVGQLEALIEEAGDRKGFDARAWMSRWLTEPLPALGNARPIDYMDTIEGQHLISQTLGQIVSGAYA